MPCLLIRKAQNRKKLEHWLEATSTMGSQQFCLKWNNHHSNIFSVFEQLLSNEALVDVTLACDGLSIKAHKMVLSACSPFFQNLFLENPCKHPIVILKDMRYQDLKAIVDFMYRGEVNITQDQLSALLKIAETLKVKGLTEVAIARQESVDVQEESQETDRNQSTPLVTLHQPQQTESSPYHRRKRGRPRKRSLSDSTQSDCEQPSTFRLRVKTHHTNGVNKGNGKTSQNNPNNTYPEPENPCNSENHTICRSPITSHPYHCDSRNQNSVLPSIELSQQACITEQGTTGEEEYEVEPSKLMEQTMTTENASVYSSNKTDASMTPVVTPVSHSSEQTRPLAESKKCTEDIAESHALVPLPIPSTPQSSSLLAQEASQDGIVQEKPNNQMSVMAAAKQLALRNAELPADFLTKDMLPENELYMIYRRSQNARQFAVNIAKVLYTPEEMRESNCRGARDKQQLDMKRLIFIRNSVFRYYSVANYAASDVWKLCCQSIDAHCRHERRLYKRSLVM